MRLPSDKTVRSIAKGKRGKNRHVVYGEQRPIRYCHNRILPPAWPASGVSTPKEAPIQLGKRIGAFLLGGW